MTWPAARSGTMVIGRAAEPEAARQDAALVIDRILAGIAGEPPP